MNSADLKFDGIGMSLDLFKHHFVQLTQVAAAQ